MNPKCHAHQRERERERGAMIPAPFEWVESGFKLPPTRERGETIHIIMLLKVTQIWDPTNINYKKIPRLKGPITYR
jgi:hypothetical protein